MQITSKKLLLPGYLLIVLMLLSVNLNAAENINVINLEKVQVKDCNHKESKTDKGFLKKFARKVKTGIVKVYRKIRHKTKRIFSKRKSKKDRKKSGFKDRKRNLFNILLFSLVFVVLASLIVYLGLSIGLYLMYILGIILIITAIVIALIYFSGRYILKPRF